MALARGIHGFFWAGPRTAFLAGPKTVFGRDNAGRFWMGCPGVLCGGNQGCLCGFLYEGFWESVCAGWTDCYGNVIPKIGALNAHLD